MIWIVLALVLAMTIYVIRKYSMRFFEFLHENVGDEKFRYTIEMYMRSVRSRSEAEALESMNSAIGIMMANFRRRISKYASLNAGNDDICPICRENMIQGENILTMDCNHYGHEKCMRDWLRGHVRCPICRQ